MAGVTDITISRWRRRYPDFDAAFKVQESLPTPSVVGATNTQTPHKAVVEATDLQWKYAEQLVRSGYRSYTRRLNRPSVNYRSAGNIGFKIAIPV